MLLHQKRVNSVPTSNPPTTCAVVSGESHFNAYQQPLLYLCCCFRGESLQCLPAALALLVLLFQGRVTSMPTSSPCSTCAVVSGESHFNAYQQPLLYLCCCFRGESLQCLPAALPLRVLLFQERVTSMPTSSPSSTSRCCS